MNNQISRQKLKPCPFCGGEPKIHRIDRSTEFFRIVCFNCFSDTGNYYTEKEAIEAWNKRVEPPADQWISCSSGVMPNNSQRVVTTHLLMRKNPYLSTAVYFKTQGQLDDHEWQGEGFYQYSNGGYSLRDDVIAWMPAEPYKGE